MTIPEPRTITGEELLSMGEVGPCELIDGRIVPLTPTGGKHGVIELNLASELKNFVRERNLGWVSTGEVGIYTRLDPDRVRGADIVFLSRQRSPEGLPQGFLDVAPELVVEIVSPSDRWEDMRQKLEEYFAIGVEQVWVVEPKNRAVLVHRSPTEVRKFGEEDTLVAEGALADFALPVADLFRD